MGLRSSAADEDAIDMGTEARGVSYETNCYSPAAIAASTNGNGQTYKWSQVTTVRHTRWVALTQAAAAQYVADHGDDSTVEGVTPAIVVAVRSFCDNTILRSYTVERDEETQGEMQFTISDAADPITP